MKNKLTTAIFILSAVFAISSCKNDKAADKEAAEPKEDKLFTVTMNLVVPKDDHFQLYYNEDGSDLYTPDKFVDVEVKGSNNPQDVTFKLPEDSFPASFRFDLGSNKEQGEVKINEFRMKYLDKNFSAKDTLFIYYFGYNQQIDYNRAKAIAKPKPIANEIYDPIFGGTEMLKAEIKKMVK